MNRTSSFSTIPEVVRSSANSPISIPSSSWRGNCIPELSNRSIESCAYMSSLKCTCIKLEFLYWTTHHLTSTSQWGMLTLELSSYKLEIPRDTCTTLSQECCRLIGLYWKLNDKATLNYLGGWNHVWGWYLKVTKFISTQFICYPKLWLYCGAKFNKPHAGWWSAKNSFSRYEMLEIKDLFEP